MTTDRATEPATFSPPETEQDPLPILDPPNATRDVPEEVTKARIEDYTDASLAGRLAHYEREALLERDPTKRRAWQNEVSRTKAEIANRKAGALNAANRIFKPRSAFNRW